MFKLSTNNEKAEYELLELAKMFGNLNDLDLEVTLSDGDKNKQKKELYLLMSERLGKTLDWGILTGVRPTKLFNQLARSGGADIAESILKNDYCLSQSKINLLRETYEQQQLIKGDNNPKAVGIYAGIPFCPSRCLYCSFTSNIINKKAASRYMDALEKEAKATASILKDQGAFAESIYIGGGTPTSLDDEDFERLLSVIKENYLGPNTREFTVECGRPDTITESKLKLVLKYGADRISINPQTMKQETLDLIGRSHKVEDIVDAFKLAKQCGIPVINMDLITGLPKESPEDFENTLKTIVALNPENITVHTLAVKKGSKLIDLDSDYAYKAGDVTRIMLECGQKILADNNYKPYYLYRQKHMAGNFENVGYCKENKASLYNIRIMEEDQSIIALGAGGISKVYYPAENRLERVPNVSNYEIYIERIDEMIKRKEIGIVL